MTRTLLLTTALMIAVATVPAATTPQAKVLDPVGTYSISTASDTGQPLAGTLVITARGSGYTGSFTSPALPAPFKVENVATNGGQMMATINNGSGLLLLWVEMAADGSFKGTWHELTPGIPATGKKVK